MTSAAVPAPFPQRLVVIGTGLIGTSVALALRERGADVWLADRDTAAARLAVELVGPAGRIMLVGIALEPLDLEAPPIVMKELELRGVIAYSRADFTAAIVSAVSPDWLIAMTRSSGPKMGSR